MIVDSSIPQSQWQLCFLEFCLHNMENELTILRSQDLSIVGISKTGFSASLHRMFVHVNWDDESFMGDWGDLRYKIKNSVSLIYFVLFKFFQIEAIAYIHPHSQHCASDNMKAGSWRLISQY